MYLFNSIQVCASLLARLHDATQLKFVINNAIKNLIAKIKYIFQHFKLFLDVLQNNLNIGEVIRKLYVC
jgi:hypothetical protein